jgi:hypothetical protein
MTGNVHIVGNLQVDGNFFAPVSLTAGGNLNMATFSITNVGTITATNGVFNTTLQIPTGTPPAPSVTGQIALNTSAASTSLAFYDGTAIRSNAFQTPRSAIIASSTLAYMNTAFGTSGSTTLNIMNNPYPSTLKRAFCKTNVGTIQFQIGNGSATTTLSCSTTGADSGVITTTFGSFANVVVVLGSTASSFDRVTLTTLIQSDVN